MCGKALLFRQIEKLFAAPPPITMFKVSRSTPAYYLTSVTHRRLPIFRTDKIKQIVCEAFDEARNSAGIQIFAYVIMPDHTHIITDSRRKINDVLRFLNGISAKRLLDHLKANDHQSSLQKLRIQEREYKHRYSVYQHHSNAFEVYGEETLLQKVNYIHFNPVRAGLVEHPNDYRFSSSRQWNEKALETEPLRTDHQSISWR